jgi:hypothetical protein
MFTSQLLYILGIELSGVTVATCMQPAIPVRVVVESPHRCGHINHRCCHSATALAVHSRDVVARGLTGHLRTPRSAGTHRQLSCAAAAACSCMPLPAVVNPSCRRVLIITSVPSLVDCFRCSPCC